MKLLRLFLKNCGVFHENVINFVDNNNNPHEIICLSGVNGTGKTTIMEIIFNLVRFLRNEEIGLFINKKKPNVLTFTEFAQLDLLIDEKVLSVCFGEREYIQKHEDKNQEFIIINSKFKKILEDIEEILKSKNEDDTDNNNLTRKNKINNLLEQTNELKLASKIKKKGQADNLLKLIANQIGKNLDGEVADRVPSLYFLGVHNRDILDIRYKSIPKYDIRYEVADTYSPEEDDLNALLVYYDYAYPERFNEIKSWVNQEILTDKSIDRINRPAFKVVVKIKGGGEHGLELLSSGEESFLVIAIQLYLRALRNSVILIDEIDQRLHPEYQQKIMRIIKNIQARSGCQIIISSHSRFIWDEVDNDAIIRLTEVIQ